MRDEAEIRIRAHRDDFHELVFLSVFRINVDRTVDVMKADQFEPKKEIVYYTESPHVTIRNKEAQDLMDQLWRLGFRPTEGQGSAGQADAMKNHLADLRTQNDRYFELLRITVPGSKNA